MNLIEILGQDVEFFSKKSPIPATTLSGEVCRTKVCRAKVTNFLKSDENFAQRIVSPDKNFARRKVSPDEKYRPPGFFVQKLAQCLMDHYWYFREWYCENDLFIYAIHDMRKIQCRYSDFVTPLVLKQVMNL